MKRYSDFEKSVIHSIIDLDDRCALGVLNNILENKIETLNRGYIDLQVTDNCVLHFDERFIPGEAEPQRGIAFNTILEELKKKLLATLALIKHLEREGMVLVSAADLELQLQTLGSLGNFNAIEYQYNNASLTELVRDYSKKEITPLEDLRALVARDFMSVEEIQHEKELAGTKRAAKLALWAMAISVGSTILSLFVGWYVPYHVTTNVKLLDKSVSIRFEEEDVKKLADDVFSRIQSLQLRKQAPSDITGSSKRSL